MALPFFYTPDYDPPQSELVLEEEISRHIISVLRMKEGERLNLTGGKGNLLEAEIIKANKKHCWVRIIDRNFRERTDATITIAVSILKNAARFEWLLEKVTEMGVSEIVPLVCERTVGQKFRTERMKAICISAMLQSQQCWLPVLHEPQQFNQTILESKHQKKFIAHCENSNKQSLLKVLPQGEGLGGASIILIGPEGDFTKQEVDFAMEKNFIPVSLGDTRLRTETAAVAAAALLTQLRDSS